MTSIWGAELYYTPDYWPVWLIAAGLIIVAMIAILVLHGFLRYALAPKQSGHYEEERVYLYSKAIRFWHWGNALLFILLLISGLLGHFSIGNVPSMVLLHKICGFILIAFWIGFVVINLTTNNGVHYKVKLQGLIGRCIKQARFYLYGIMKGEPHPFAATPTDKFNPLQQLAYLGVMFGLVPLLLITGVLCLYPEVLGYGYWMLKVHFILGIVALMFICAHFYLCTLGDTFTQTFRSMIDGHHRHQKHGESTTTKN
ncbi:thiosulfate reductase cytochrome B subunit [Proteus mirabilis]|uniref:thiosulfate reductase cytochrome B subunit n=1 Tax=Proteus mirabilis TaxID=584 RepID=UPI0018C796E5|nr:thiosulfate reductase cytochrome B subunit [Proteus mirabilis]MBG6016123.1 thiosulfate reductase cytochrome B subunit [Proteus mirabilis]MBU9979696.1 thiosulfate reductase cytochrome B subunit [Proteus mirabilis]MDX4951654.1 thiosulfate reductase cytochrome B subunit [Proteus mirabilis]